jgi:elongation factor 1-gamma
MKLYCNTAHTMPNAFARIVQDMTAQPAELVIADEEFRKTPGYKALTTTDKFPLLQTADGCLHESTAIAKYFCTLAGGKFLGTTAVERA